jgi:TPP-dependent pyruvate/acetoin dehydrogenase alpha subunit
MAIYEAVKNAVDRGRRGDGPSLIEARSMRMRGHSEHDDPSYVPKELIEEWKSRDPLENYERYLLNKKIITNKKITELHNKIDELIKEATEYAEQSPFPEPEDCMKDLFA